MSEVKERRPKQRPEEERVVTFRETFLSGGKYFYQTVIFFNQLVKSHHSTLFEFLSKNQLKIGGLTVRLRLKIKFNTIKLS